MSAKREHDATAEAFQAMSRAMRALVMAMRRLTPSSIVDEAEVYVEARLREVERAMTPER